MLEGRSKTFVENFSAAGTRPGSIARHNFLKLVMPLKGSNYLQPRIAEAGITYSFLFNVSWGSLILNAVKNSLKFLTVPSNLTPCPVQHRGAVASTYL